MGSTLKEVILSVLFLHLIKAELESQIPDKSFENQMMLLKETQIKPPLDNKSGLKRAIPGLVRGRRVASEGRIPEFFEFQRQVGANDEQPDNEESANRVYIQHNNDDEAGRESEVIKAYKGARSARIFNIAGTVRHSVV
jgi:hypothetical protein